MVWSELTLQRMDYGRGGKGRCKMGATKRDALIGPSAKDALSWYRARLPR